MPFTAIIPEVADLFASIQLLENSGITARVINQSAVPNNKPSSSMLRDV
jgi:hypothetical protein